MLYTVLAAAAIINTQASLTKQQYASYAQVSVVSTSSSIAEAGQGERQEGRQEEGRRQRQGRRRQEEKEEWKEKGRGRAGRRQEARRVAGSQPAVMRRVAEIQALFMRFITIRHHASVVLRA